MTDSLAHYMSCTVCSAPTDPPTYIVDDSFVVTEGEPLRIDLVLDANPTPSVFDWTLNGQPLTVLPGGELGVDFIDFGGTISRTASGDYLVTSTNDAGSGSASFRLDVYCKWTTVY